MTDYVTNLSKKLKLEFLDPIKFVPKDKIRKEMLNEALSLLVINGVYSSFESAYQTIRSKAKKKLKQ